MNIKEVIEIVSDETGVSKTKVKRSLALYFGKSGPYGPFFTKPLIKKEVLFKKEGQEYLVFDEQKRVNLFLSRVKRIRNGKESEVLTVSSKPADQRTEPIDCCF